MGGQTSRAVPPPPAPVPIVGNGGIWEGAYGLPITPAAAANLPDGRILTWSAYAKMNFGGSGQTWISIFDPETKESTNELIVDTKHDMFCPGTAYLVDGRVMITGGSNSEATTIYDPTEDSWTRGDNMNIPRGYHSMTVTGDGSVFTLGGSWSGGAGGKHGELWTEGSGWQNLGGVKSGGTLLTADSDGVGVADNHMWLFEAPNGKIFHAGPSRHTHWIDTKGSGSVTYAVKRGNNDMMCGNGIMFDVGKLLIVGGSMEQNRGEATPGAFVFDLNNGDEVGITQVGNLIHPRVFANSVVLPSGEVVVVGGQTFAAKFSDNRHVKQAEIFDPNTNTFKAAGSMRVPRVYHSVCILMKDARVWCGGGGLCGNCGVNHPDGEIFTPPYLNGVTSRPQILSVSSTEVEVGGVVTVDTNTNDCTFALVRLAAVTHSTNNDLRRFPLEIQATDGSTSNLLIPSNPSVALPGKYFLFATDINGVPSVGEVITVTLGPPTEAPTMAPTQSPIMSPTRTPTMLPTGSPTVTPQPTTSVNTIIVKDNVLGGNMRWSISGRSGLYSLRFRYALGGSSSRPGKILINGIEISTISFLVTSATNWDVFTLTDVIEIQMPAGHSIVSLEATGSSGLPNIDFVEISGYDVGPLPKEEELLENPTFADNLNGWTVLNPTGGQAPTKTRWHEGIAINGGNEQAGGDGVQQPVITASGQWYYVKATFRVHGQNRQHQALVEVLNGTSLLSSKLVSVQGSVSTEFWVQASSTETTLRITNPTSSTSVASDLLVVSASFV